MILLKLPLLFLVSSVAARSGPLEEHAAAAQRVDGSILKPLIVGGTFVGSITQVPWQVFIALNFGSSSSYSLCGGSVINSQWVLTAAHCVLKTTGKPGWVTLMFGATERNLFQAKKLTVTVDSANIFPHEQYSPSGNNFDIALIKVNIPLPLGSDNTQFSAIKLPTACDIKRGRTFAGSTAILSGWGRTNGSDPTSASPTLKWVNATVLSQLQCFEQYPNGAAVILPQQICAGTTGGVDTCQGDSGGPMAVMDEDGKFLLVGVTSFGIGCAQSTPGVYARTSFFRDWIKTTTGLNLK